MISFVRRLIHSRLGVIIGLIFLGLVGFAFAAGDITGSGGLSQLTGGGGGTIAKVDGQKLSAGELIERSQKIFDVQRRQQPGVTMQSLLDQGMVEQLTDQLITGLAVLGFTDDQDMAISKRMVDGEIASIPAFKGATGQFDENLYRQLLKQQGISEAAIRADVQRDLAARQLLGPTAMGAKLGDDLVLPYASLLLEIREGRAAAIPAQAFLSPTPPSEQALAAWYRVNGRRFEIPEQRTLRYALIDASRFDQAAEPNDAEVASYFKTNAAQFAASETRAVEQLILPTEAAAKAILGQLSGGTNLAAAAKKAGLSTSRTTSLTQPALAGQTSPQLAAAAFGAAQNKPIGPFKLGLGWSVAEVTGISATPARTLEQARPTIVQALRAEKRHGLLADFTGKIEDQSQEGATFDEVVKDFGLTVTTTPPLVAQGISPSDPAFTPSEELRTLLPQAFEAEPEGDPVLATIAADQRYALIDVVNVIPAAPPPLAKVRAQAIQLYQLSQANQRASTAAEQVLKKLKSGVDLAVALAELKVKLPPIEPMKAQRLALIRGGQQVPEPLTLLFALREKTQRSLPLPGDRGFLIVRLDRLIHGDAGKRADLVQATRGELEKVVGNEYGEQFSHAIQQQLGVKRYPDQIIAVKQQLRRNNGGGQ